MRRIVVILSLALMCSTVICSLSFAADSMSVVNVGERKVELTSTLGIDHVKYFTLDGPKRLVVDLYGVVPGSHADTIPLYNGFDRLRAGALPDKSRFVFDVSGNQFPVFNVDIASDKATVSWEPLVPSDQPMISGSAQIVSIDFSSDAGKSIVAIKINGDVQVSDVIKADNTLLYEFQNTTIPRSLSREFDTLSFPSAIYSTYAYMVNANGKPNVRFMTKLKGDVQYSLKKTVGGVELVVDDGAYAVDMAQSTGTTAVAAGGVLSADNGELSTGSAVATVSPVVSNQVINTSLKKVYTGEKTSLVFDKADVRDVLRLLAEISNMNIIASDDVKGDITLRLIDVPWDQALDLVLDVLGLGTIEDGTVIRILPMEKINQMKQAELANKRSQEKLENLETAVITVSYADLKSVSGPVKKILSDRGSITEDSRNKLLIVNDIHAKIEKIQELVKILDTPERQVMIEARIVQVNSNYTRDLGINWYFTRTDDELSGMVGGGGDFFVDMVDDDGTLLSLAGLNSQLEFGNIFNDTILDMQISALETDGKAKVISTPRVTTLNGEKALISQGTTIPYQSYADGATKTEFVDAVLKLEVTPVINPDSSIILDILATNDTPSVTTGATAPSIDTQKAQTKVLIHDGETTVLGGIYVETQNDSDGGIPGLKNIPILGYLFKAESTQTTKSELLIFVTPRIVTID